MLLPTMCVIEMYLSKIPGMHFIPFNRMKRNVLKKMGAIGLIDLKAVRNR